jgi:hypothetical protein
MQWEQKTGDLEDISHEDLLPSHIHVEQHGSNKITKAI